MGQQLPHERIENIPIAQIKRLNPRTRNQRIHKEITENMGKIGLKRPIVVARRNAPCDGHLYDLICGQGRIESFIAMGQEEIPAFVVEATEEDCLVMSLVENVARCKHRPIELMREIGNLRKRNHTDKEISTMIGVTAVYVNMIGRLLDNGEEKLLSAVETGSIPMSMAMRISRSSEAEVQSALAVAYEDGFRGRKLTMLQKLLEQRAKRKKAVSESPLGSYPRKRKKITAAELRKMYEREAEKQQLMSKKLTLQQERLTFTTVALKNMLANAEFRALLCSEGLLDEMPRVLKERIALRAQS